MSLSRREGTGDPRKRVARPFRIVSWDPGGTTGVASAHWLPSNEDTPLTTLEQIHFEQFHMGPGDHHSELCDFLRAQYWSEAPPLEIVCESFTFRQHINKAQAKTKVELISVEYIGVIKLLSEQYDFPLTFNTASAGKTFITDEKIKALGLWRPGMPHAMDATRHLLRYLVVNKRIREPITSHWIS